MTRADSDTGLLAPGRAGSAAEAATGDTAFLQALLDAEAALPRAQAAAGLAPAEAAEAVAAAADASRFDARDLALRARTGGNPVIPLVADLTALVPEPHREYVHRGATSQDIMDTAMMLMAARTLDLILGDLDRAAGALARLAAAHRTTAMPARTLTQHAVPTTFGLKAAGWRSLVLDARDRLRTVRAALPCQLGGAAGTLAAFTAFPAPGGTVTPHGGAVRGREPAGPAHVDALLDAYAHQLGLARPVLPWHTLRTPVADLASALAFTATALGKPAADVATLSRTEIGELAEGVRGGSSAMPHKANPVRATLLAAAAHRAPALAATLCAALAAPDERPAGTWHAEWEPLRELLRLTGGAARDAVELTEGLRVHPDRMRAHLDLTHGLIVSERLSAELAPLLGRARAKQLLTEAARRAEERGRMLVDVLAELREITALGLDLVELTDPARYTGHAAHLTDRALERS
ncbi:3-carboxy-cis,cis-muconate cycloisomerase [Streptomyces sulfonofaciens]|uniref:3-carboxy-cis,cis-muconate cycloisomerase n=1 Tax=Streptomyces sulfonofaciens TaxID=68272 RepID=A0A919L4L5_9ACTN|nr:3-carboxy-cis,cis-muconate cycloisomerase [Streptomyces sulfonofaciens]GHH82496.1 3-carboxy-cis,cis-muconate cycloisomerase [Streptomyces sulfonofaciens]